MDNPNQNAPQPAPVPPHGNPLLKVRVPYVSYVIIVVTIFVYVLQILSELHLLGFSPVLYGEKINEAIIAGQWWRLITPVFLHGPIWHIGFNMYALFIIGQDVERLMGHRRFILLYFLAGFAGNVFSFLFTPNPSLGASTAIFGLIAAQGIFVYINRRFLVNARRILQNILQVAAINLFIGLTPGIDNWGHVGGLCGGLIFAWIAGPKLIPQEVMPGAFQLVDEREMRDEITGALLVFGAFSALAAIKIFGIL